MCLINESQFATQGLANANGDWKGLIFSDKKSLLRALEEWHVTHFVRMKVKKSDTCRYTCVCVENNCSWRLHAHKPKGAAYFLVSQYNGSHNCVIAIGNSMHRNCTSTLICEKILPSMRASLSMSVKEIQLKIKDDFKIEISYELAWKARSRALRIIYGSWERSFSDLPRYLSMMQASNPGTVWTINPPWTGRDVQQFRRVFWAFGPSIEGWKCCQPVVSVDGTHLYGKYEGCALIATSIDANGGLYPIAFAICDKENGDNWQWFLHSLREFVTRERKVCIISDRFSGNKEVVRSVFSPDDGHAHRWCLRHIKANLKKAGFTDKVVLDKFYINGCVNEIAEFNRLKEQFKTECEDAWQWVEDRLNNDREYWALTFDGGRRYGVMTTNWSESLNSVLRGTRSLPVTAFVIATFYRVNQAFVERSEEGRKMTNQLCPKVIAKIRHRQSASRGYQVCRFGPCQFEVNTGTSLYPVTINGSSSSCVCEVFRLTKLSCSHMLACCGEQWHKTDFHTLCDDWHFTEMYRNTYSVRFHPVPDKRFWPSMEGPTMLPPALRNKKGRPKSTRIRNSMDVRETTGATKHKCSHCSVLGHYKKRCPQFRKTRGGTT
ncbi:uncharacterized protein LOC144564632 [Carex rostrata]